MKLRTGISPSQYPKTTSHELRDLLGVGLVAEDVDLRGGVVEIPPRVEVDDVFLWPIGPGSCRRAWFGPALWSVGWSLGSSVMPAMLPAPLGMGAEPAFEEVATGGDARQQLARVGGLQDPHGAVGHALRQIGIERDQLMVQLGRVLVDRGEQRGRGRNARHAGSM